MRHHFVSSVLGLALCAAAAAPAVAQDGASADQIMEKVLARDAFGWDEAETRVRMILTEKSGKRRERAMENLRKKKDGRSMSVVRFRAPQEVAGTAFLMLERKEGETEQWIYLPKLQRVRRVVGREREGSFMGSDFSYADMERRDTRQSKHRRLPDEKIGTVPVYVIESTPTEKSGSSYSKIQTWVRKDNYLPLRIRFYDAKGQPLKTFYSRRIRDVDGQAVIVESKMQNQQTGHSTELVVDDIRSRNDIPDTIFTPTGIQHL